MNRLLIRAPRSRNPCFVTPFFPDNLVPTSPLRRPISVRKPQPNPPRLPLPSMFQLILEQALNGLQFGLMLFLLAAGLTLVFGIMDCINLAHGSLYMVGATSSLPPRRRPIRSGSGWASGWPGAAVLGLVLELALLFRQLYKARPPVAGARHLCADPDRQRDGARHLGAGSAHAQSPRRWPGRSRLAISSTRPIGCSSSPSASPLPACSTCWWPRAGLACGYGPALPTAR